MGERHPVLRWKDEVKDKQRDQGHRKSEKEIVGLEVRHWLCTCMCIICDQQRQEATLIDARKGNIGADEMTHPYETIVFRSNAERMIVLNSLNEKRKGKGIRRETKSMRTCVQRGRAKQPRSHICKHQSMPATAEEVEVAEL